jgi:large subunit ribosomal protein L6
MSRVAKNPVTLPKGVEVNLAERTVEVKGPKGTLTQGLPPFVKIDLKDGALHFNGDDAVSQSDMMAGTARALLNNMVHGVSEGFQRKLTLIGVGYRAQVQGQSLNLTLGFSHPVNFQIPQGIQIECPTQTEILVKGADKQVVGQTAANIRAYRPPEPYKGKGIRYSDEVVVQKETKKKK